MNEAALNLDALNEPEDNELELSMSDDESTDPSENLVIPLNQFVNDFRNDLLASVSQQNPPLYSGIPDPNREFIMDELLRDPFPAQRDVVQAVTTLLVDANQPAAIINAEMGTGKTIMAIATAAVMYAEGYRKHLVLSPPHLVYKWRREIKETISNAKVWILNGPDTLAKLILLRKQLNISVKGDAPEFFILGRVRMRMGFHWIPAFAVRRFYRVAHVEENNERSQRFIQKLKFASCPRCGTLVTDSDDNPIAPELFPRDTQLVCHQCSEPLWTLHRPLMQRAKSRREIINSALCQLPTIGPKTADKLITMLGEDVVEDMLADNVYEFINVMNGEGELVFSDRQAMRMERAMANMEFSFGQGGYQPTEFIKRYLPNHYFDMMIVDEGHEYKNEGSAQGQAMGVLAAKSRKTLLLTGTLMGGYASDLFFLLWRILTPCMLEDGFGYSKNGSLSGAAMAFMREHGVLKDIYKVTEGDSHKTSRGKKVSVRTVKAPGFGPQGIIRFLLPYTVFLKLKDIGGNVLPPYDEFYWEMPLTAVQAEKYEKLSTSLQSELKNALRKGDNSLLGVVLNVLLAWPDCCFREEIVKHPRSKNLLAMVSSVFDETDNAPKEEELIKLCLEEKSHGRRVMVYTTYSGKRDTCSRMKALLTRSGLKVSVLRSSVDTSRREDWIFEQVDKGVDVVVCNPELVKTGLDLLDFPTIVFMQTGYNVYTILQASRRSWRIGQKQAVKVFFFGYAGTAQTQCLELLAKKISVSQSTSGDMPDTGLDVLNSDGDSIEVALAKQLAA
jgi:SNF2 family DNA or RNA helicase